MLKCKIICLVLILITSQFYGIAQTCKTEAKVINTKAALLESVKNEPGKKLIALQKFIPGIVIDLRYASTNNFTKAILYRHPIACLRQAPANALLEVQKELHKKGLGLKIYDAFRPFSVTCRMWQLASDKHYVANPRKGSHHNRAIAVDLTIVDLKTGKELDMGTPFDNFTDTAHHDFTQLPAEVIANRRLLKYVMWQHGFNFVPTEWWHYHWRDKSSYEVIDLDFDDIKDIIINP